MAEKVVKKEVRGKEIICFYMDGCGVSEFKRAIGTFGDEIRKGPEKGVLALAIGGPATPIFTDKETFIEFFVKNGPYIRASAAACLDRTRQAMITSVLELAGRRMEFFDTEEQALEWLAEK